MYTNTMTRIHGHPRRFRCSPYLIILLFLHVIRIYGCSSKVFGKCFFDYSPSMWFHESSLTVQDSFFDTLSPFSSSSVLSPPSLSLTVNAPPYNCVVHQHHNELAIIVNTPLSSYTLLPTHDSNRFMEQLTNTAQLVPETWTLSQWSFIVTIVTATFNMLYSLSVALNCSWNCLLDLTKLMHRNVIYYTWSLLYLPVLATYEASWSE